MRKFLLLTTLLIITGCTSVQIPAYLKDTNPYTKRFYGSYDKISGTITETLADLGWEIEKTSDASVYEQNRESDMELGEKNTVFITKIRQTPLVVGTRYAKMNVFVRSKGEMADVEIRYVTVNDLPFKNVETYSNDSAVERIFSLIEENLNIK